MTRRSLFRTAAAAFAGSLLTRLPLVQPPIQPTKRKTHIPGINPDNPTLWVNTVWTYNPETRNSGPTDTLVLKTLNLTREEKNT